MLGVVGGKGNDGCRTGSIIVSSGIKYLLSEVAEVVVVGGEDIATVVTLALNLADDVEALVVLQELSVDIEADALYALDGLGCYPNDGFVYDPMAVCLEELDGRLPCVDQSGVGASAVGL